MRVTLTQNPKPWDGDRRWEALAEISGPSTTTISTLGPDPLTAIWLLCEVLAKELEDVIMKPKMSKGPEGVLRALAGGDPEQLQEALESRGVLPRPDDRTLCPG